MGILDQIISAESGGDPNARNPRSSAAGLGQFIDATWLAMLAKHRPDIQGSPQELLALKTDPALSRQMTEAYTQDNGALLANSGLPVTPGTTYLAHFAGPQGAVKVLQSDPSTPVSDVLGQKAVEANPFLRGMTAGQLQAWADKKMGGKAGALPIPPPQQPAIASNQPAPVAGFSFPQQAQQAQPPQPESFDSIPAAALPLFPPQRKPIDLRALKAAFRPANFYRG